MTICDGDVWTMAVSLLFGSWLSALCTGTFDLQPDRTWPMTMVSF